MTRRKGSMDYIVFEARDDFGQFVVERSSATLGNPQFLADYIVAWLVAGNGVSRCNGDPQTYLIVLGAIIDQWRRYNGKGMLDHREEDPRDPDGPWILVEERRPYLIAPVPIYNHRIFNPAFFVEAAARKQHHRGE